MFKKILAIVLVMQAMSLYGVEVVNNTSREILFNSFDFHKTYGAQTSNVGRGERYRAGTNPYTVSSADQEDWYIKPGHRDRRNQVRSMKLWVKSKTTWAFVYESSLSALDDLVVVNIEENIDGSINIKYVLAK